VSAQAPPDGPGDPQSSEDFVTFRSLDNASNDNIVGFFA